MATNVLIVLDGIYRFETATVSDPDFTYTVLINALTSAGMTVTKAHRETNGADATATPGFGNFHFDALPSGHSLSDFDVIWLIGFEGRNADVGSAIASGTFKLTDAELSAIGLFMADGGGVFATGDHDSVGADLCGRIPRVRAMRSWFGASDTFTLKPVGLPANNPRETGNRADTVHKKIAGEMPASQYPVFTAGENYVWFDNQSDHFPQTITPTTPTHAILRRDGHDITVFPDHMHEGNALGVVGTFDYEQMSPFGDTGKKEFRTVAGHREPPKVIATSIGHPQASRFASSAALIGAQGAADVPVNTLSTYDGRVAGVGRIVTGSTFHHYIDINLIGSTIVQNEPALSRVGADAVNGAGFAFAGAESTFADIKAVFVNITNWLARPKPTIQLILERSTFSQDEAPSGSQFAGAVLITVDGMKPSQFPGGGIPGLGAITIPVPWAPTINVVGGAPITITPTGVSSDDPTMPDRLQRFTFVYKVTFTGNAFGFAPDFSNITVNASLPSPVSPSPLTDSAFLQLVKSANPFMLDLADGNDTSWLSSDVKVFHLVEGENLPGIGGASLPMGATRSDALTFIRNLANNINSVQFTGLSGNQAMSALSLLPRTTMNNRSVYNFAVARVRLNSSVANADNVRLFVRIFSTVTTAGLTYRESSPGIPIEGYLQTAGASPIALPGKSGTEWISFPFFAANREPTPEAQSDPDNVKTILNTDDFKFYGVLLDNNLDDPYPGLNPGAPTQPSIRSLVNGHHQCLVAQIEFAGTPIPDQATPWTSDKLSQRNIATVEVANPGLDASRTASHTFEIAATPHAVTDMLWPDELLLDWAERTPDGTMLRIYIPSWDAYRVVELADRFYPRHEIEALDEFTIELPGGGTRYVPIPQSLHLQTGVISAELPLGILKGQRFDVSVRQISNRGRNAKIPPPKIETITLEEAEKLIATLPAVEGRAVPGKGAFDLGKNRVLLTDMSVFDAASDHAIIIEQPDPKAVQAALAESRQWRETIGAFQLAIPVSTKGNMLLDHMRLLSVMRWRVAHLPRNSRWRQTLLHYVGLLSDKVQALGGNPFEVPATPDGAIPQLPWLGGDGHGGVGTGSEGVGTGDLFDPQNPMTRGCLFGFLIALLLVIILGLIYALQD
jgi:hypothetical protein